MIKHLVLIVTVISYSTVFSSVNDCHKVINNKLDQFIIGYGSLMNEKSKRSTDPDVEDGYPVELSGFNRGWYVSGKAPGPNATFLGVKIDAKASLNAVIYKLPTHSISKYDARESLYCRDEIQPQQIKMLIDKPLPSGQYWIYVMPDKSAAMPTQNIPIVQSYVDIFLAGCIQVQHKYKLTDFAERCISTTQAWSKYWVNDRIYPRRPWEFQPDAIAIDKLLKNKIPEYFSSIQLDK